MYHYITSKSWSSFKQTYQINLDWLTGSSNRSSLEDSSKAHCCGFWLVLEAIANTCIWISSASTGVTGGGLFGTDLIEDVSGEHPLADSVDVLFLVVFKVSLKEASPVKYLEGLLTILFGRCGRFSVEVRTLLGTRAPRTTRGGWADLLGLLGKMNIALKMGPTILSDSALNFARKYCERNGGI